MAAVGADLAEAERAAEREARLVLRKDARDELPQAAARALVDQRVERDAAEAAAARHPRDVDREFAHPRVRGALAVMVRNRPGDHLAVFLGDDERQVFLEPRNDVRCRSGLGLERRAPVLDSLVVDAGDRSGVARSGGPHPHVSTRRSASTQSMPIASLASCVAEAMCGARTTLSSERSAFVTSGSRS